VLFVIGHSLRCSVPVSEALIKVVSVDLNVSGSTPVHISSGSVWLVAVGLNHFFHFFNSRVGELFVRVQHSTSGGR
jgi:hypothetical protein